MIELDDVFVLYPCVDREVAALRGLSLSVAARERVVVTGPSGSGKSTLVKLVTGQVRPSAGAAVVLDHDLANASSRAVAALQRTRVGMITQQTVNNLAPELSVIDNAAMQCRLTGSSKAEAARAALEMLDRLDVADLADRALRTISAGEAQRVALAAALSHRPHIIVADEPTGTLDADNATIVFDLLAQVCDELGAAMLVVSHDPEAGRIGHRVLDIRDGRLGAEQLLGTDAVRLVVDNRGWVRLPEPERVRAGISSRAIVSSTNGHGPDAVVLRPPAGAPTTIGTAEESIPVGVEHTPLVILDAVGRSIGDTRILPATSLTVNAGELLIVAGRSGSGKTTLLGLIAGLAEPSEGTITRSADVAVAVAANSPGFAESMTVRQNIELACTVRGREVDDGLTSMIDEHLTSVSLIDLAERPVSTLSGGERQRAAIVRALASNADLVLLDEPTSQLDQGLARRIAAFLVGQARRGRAIVCASHEPELIAAADRVQRLGVRINAPGDPHDETGDMTERAT